MGVVLAADCEQARVRVSLALDGELSQVEEAALRAHVGRCAACAEFERDVDALTQEIRRAPLQRAARAAAPDRGRSTGRHVLRVGVAAAAAVAIAAALGSLAGSLSASSGAGGRSTVTAVRVASLPTLVTGRPGTRLQQPPIAL